MPDPVTGVAAGVGLIGADMQADAASGAAQTAAEAAQFRPYGITSRFGRSGFTYDNAGNVVGGGYQAAPDVAAMREGLMNIAGGSLGQVNQARAWSDALGGNAQMLGQLGSQYIAESPQQAAQKWMTQQQGLLTPARDQAYARMQQNLYNTGRGGLAVAQGGTLGAANPEAQAYYNALAQQDAQLAAQATQAGQQQTTFGAGLLGTAANVAQTGYGLQSAAMQPWQSAFQGAQALESAAQGSLDMSSALGARQSTAGANMAPYLAKQGVSPVGVGLMNLAQTPGLFSGIGSSGYSNPLTGGSLSTWAAPAGVTSNVNTPGSQANMLWNQVYG